MFNRRCLSSVALLCSCVIVLLANANCGEFLLLHYLTCSDGPFSRGRAAEQANGSSQTPTGTEPTASEFPYTSGVTEPTTPPTDPPSNTPPASCLDGDLNKDGKVDGLDIQILVDCLLHQ